VSRFAVTTVDRRREYYAKAGAVIASDPLSYYTRAEAGRRFQHSLFRLPRAFARMAQMAAESLQNETYGEKA